MSQAPPPGAQFSWHQLQHGFDASPSSSPSRVVQHQVAHRHHHHGGAAGGGGAAPPRQHVAHPRAAPPPPAAAAAAGHVRAGSASSPHSYGSGGSSSAHLSSTPPHAHGFMYYSANGGAPTSPAAPQHPRQPPPQQQQHQQQHQQQTQEAAAGASLSSSAPDAYESGSSRLLQWSGNDDGGDGDGLDDEVAQGLLGSSIFALLNEPSVQGQSPAQFAGAMAAAQEQQYSHQHQAQPYGAFQPAPGQFAAAPQYDASFPFAHNQQGAEPQANYSSGPVGVAAHQSSAPAAAISRKGSSGGLSAESAEFTPSIAAAEINAMGTEALLAVASDMPEAIITGIKPKRDGNAIWVSFGRSPLYYAQIAVNMLKTHDDVHVHGLAKAVAIAIRVVVLLEEHKLGRIANISTGLTADTKKPRIHIVFAKDEGDAEPA